MRLSGIVATAMAVLGVLAFALTLAAVAASSDRHPHASLDADGAFCFVLLYLYCRLKYTYGYPRRLQVMITDQWTLPPLRPGWSATDWTVRLGGPFRRLTASTAASTSQAAVAARRSSRLRDCVCGRRGADLAVVHFRC